MHLKLKYKFTQKRKVSHILLTSKLAQSRVTIGMTQWSCIMGDVATHPHYWDKNQGIQPLQHQF